MKNIYSFTYAGLIVVVCALQVLANQLVFEANDRPNEPNGAKNGAPQSPVEAPKAKKPTDAELDLLLQKYEQLHKLPNGLLKAIAMVESSRNPAAVNARTGDYGLLQVNAKTAASLGLAPEQLLELHTNLKTGASIMQYMQRKFGHTSNWECRYNIGTASLEGRRGEVLRNLCATYMQKLAEAGYDGV